MKYEVDQSVRIEQLSQDTIIGIGGNDFYFACRLSRRLKRHFNEYFRLCGKPKYCAPILFACAIVLALKKAGRSITNIVIDDEYKGYESLIKRIVQDNCLGITITIKHIGKLSPAHQAAYGAHLGKRRIICQINRRELEKMVYSYVKIKDDRRTPSPGMNRDSKVHNRPV